MKKPNVAYRALRYLKNHGLKETIERAKQGNEPVVPPKNNVIGFYRFVVDNDPIPFNQKEYEKHKNDKKKILNWVVPEMGPGSGGHTTIFRFISNLERLGFHSRVYLYMSPNFQDNASIRKFLKEYFPLLVPEVEICTCNRSNLLDHRLLRKKIPEYDFEVLLRTGFRAAFLCTRFRV